ILSIGFGGRPHKIVGASDVGLGVMLQNLEPEGVQTVRRDRVVWELRSRRGCRVENRLRKDSLPLRDRGNDAEARDAGSQPRTLPVHEEERLVGLKRTA